MSRLGVEKQNAARVEVDWNSVSDAQALIRVETGDDVYAPHFKVHQGFNPQWLHNLENHVIDVLARTMSLGEGEVLRPHAKRYALADIGHASAILIG